jgi:hypothetical protein
MVKAAARHLIPERDVAQQDFPPAGLLIHAGRRMEPEESFRR